MKREVINAAYLQAIDAWCQTTQVKSYNPLHSATHALAQFQAGRMTAGSASADILTQNQRDEHDPDYDRYLASLVNDVNNELFASLDPALQMSRYPALDRVFKVSQAIDNNDINVASGFEFEELMNTAYKQFNTRRLKVETGVIQETPQRQQFNDEFYTAMLCMYADPLHAKNYLSEIEPSHYSDDIHALALMDAMQELVEHYNTSKIADITMAIEQCFTKPSAPDLVLSASQHIDRIRKGKSVDGKDILPR